MNFIRKKCITIFSSVLCCVITNQIANAASNQGDAAPESYAAQQSVPTKQTVADTATPAATDDPNAPAQTAADVQPEVTDPYE